MSYSFGVADTPCFCLGSFVAWWSWLLHATLTVSCYGLCKLRTLSDQHDSQWNINCTRESEANELESIVRTPDEYMHEWTSPLHPNRVHEQRWRMKPNRESMSLGKEWSSFLALPSTFHFCGNAFLGYGSCPKLIYDVVSWCCCKRSFHWMVLHVLPLWSV